MCPRIIAWVRPMALGCALAAALPATATAGPEAARVLSAAQSTDVGLTIYTAFTEQQRFGIDTRKDVHFALVKDRRRFEVRPGTNWIRFTDVAATIEPTSVSFQSLTDPAALRVLEQSYRYDLASGAAILKHSVGKRARFRRTLPDGRGITFAGTLLTPQGDVVRTNRGIVLDPQGSITLDRLPEGLIRRPELLWKLQAQSGGQHTGEIAYFARDISWRADYRALLAPGADHLALAGWVTVENRSGASYPNAALQLVAGDVHRAEEPEPVYDQDQLGMPGNARAMKAAGPPQFVEESFFEYHLYTLQRRTTIADQETKQIQFLDAPRVQARKVYLFDALRPDRPGVAWPAPLHLVQVAPEGKGFLSRTEKVRVALEIRNAEAEGLGMPLPKGKITFYQADRAGGEQFLGEDTIDHTPKDEELRLLIGNAFDLTGTRQAVDARYDPTEIRVTLAVSLRNAGEEAVTVQVYEHLPDGATLVESTLPAETPDAFTLRFEVPVPARGNATLNYQVRIPR
ncbi:MAG: hypothetical protein GX774_01680 [Armatimonadetes bacterium]|nr:hypothetical protein [Armatimonadota bacterium]